MSWLAATTARGVVHVTPVEDWIEHEESVGCVCGPRVQACLGANRWIDVPDGAVVVAKGVMVTHHSLDGRELEEHDA